MLLRSFLLVLVVFLAETTASSAQKNAHNPTIGNAALSEGVVITLDDSKFLRSARERKAPFGITSEWITDPDFGIATARANATLPLLFGSTPPPLVKVGFAYTNLAGAGELSLPEDVFEYTIGVSWIRKLNERWTIRSMLGVGFATDHLNTSSDAWQFRGGVFGIYKRNECLSWTFGALATGRDDLPVIPAIGAVWMQTQNIRYDFAFPNPRVNFLIWDDGVRQQWAYMGCGINGTTWAYERVATLDDRLTYKDWRIVFGWESRPSGNSNLPFAIGKSIQAEIGYVFSREFEFEEETRVEPLNDSFMIRTSTRF